MSVTTEPATVFGENVAEQAKKAQRSGLLAQSQEIGIGAIWIVFYVVVAVAAAIHHMLHTIV